MPSLKDKLSTDQFVVTAEITPPVSCDAADLVSKAAPLKGLADAINVTDGAGARAHMGAVAAATILLREGIEPILQLACRDRNRIALQGEFHSQLVITDIFMPEKEGIETIRELKEKFPGVKVIAISGGSRRAAPHRSFTVRELGVVASELGVVAVLQKPFDGAELLQSVNSAL